MTTYRKKDFESVKDAVLFSENYFVCIYRKFVGNFLLATHRSFLLIPAELQVQIWAQLSVVSRGGRGWPCSVMCAGRECQPPCCSISLSFCAPLCLLSKVVAIIKARTWGHKAISGKNSSFCTRKAIEDGSAQYSRNSPDLHMAYHSNEKWCCCLNCMWKQLLTCVL